MKWLRCSSRNSLKKTNPQSGRQNRPLFCMSGSAPAAPASVCERTRYQKQAFTVPNMRAVLKKASWGTRRIFGSIRCKKQASTVRKRYSVQKTGSCGTEWVFKGTRCAEQAPGVRLASRNDPSGEGTQNGTQKAVRNSLQKATQNGTREATQNAIFICEIKDLI